MKTTKATTATRASRETNERLLRESNEDGKSEWEDREPATLAHDSFQRWPSLRKCLCACCVAYGLVCGLALLFLSLDYGLSLLILVTCVTCNL